MCPCGVIAVTVTLAVEGPGSARNSPAVLPDGGTPGMTSRVGGAAVPGSQAAAAPVVRRGGAGRPAGDAVRFRGDGGGDAADAGVHLDGQHAGLVGERGQG